MAQDITIAGASFSAVPAIIVPKSAGGTALFADPSGVTAEAGDVASGKLFLDSSGTLTEGTSSGGGGTVTIPFSMRPDAELVRQYSYDKRIVADEGIAIPSYTTSAVTLKAAQNYGAFTCDRDNYDYCVCYRTLTIPEYSTYVPEKGRNEFYFSAYFREYASLPTGSIKAANGIVYNSAPYTYTSTQYIGLIYWTSASAISLYSGTYGCYQSTPSTSSGSSSFNLYAPALCMRGNTTYLPSSVWNTITDIRYQYIIEVYRAPKGSLNIDGWSLGAQVNHIVKCWDGDGTLT